MVCFDTSFVIDYLKGNDAAKEILDSFQKGNEVLTIPSPVVMELTAGAHLSKKRIIEIDKIKSFLSSFVVLNFDMESAFIAGEIESKLINSGKMIDVEDVMIASISIANKETLVTRNLKHFSRIKELKIVDY